MDECQYCGQTKGIEHWVPAGNLCHKCRKNITKIRKFKTGIPEPKISPEMHRKFLASDLSSSTPAKQG
jgi:hypothetical protein